jgi:hypothetical protein
VTDDLTGRQKGEELPVDVQLAPTPPGGAESQAGQTASLFEEPSPSPHETKIHGVLTTDEEMHLDEIIEQLEAGALFFKNRGHSSTWAPRC